MGAAAPATSPDIGKSGVGSVSGAVKTWRCAIHSAAPLTDAAGTKLEIVIVDIDSETRSEPVSIDAWRSAKTEINVDGQKGWVRDGPVTLPASIKNPGAVLIRKLPGKDGKAGLEYISYVKLISPTSVHVLPAHSYVSSDQGWRSFFTGTAFLPKDTPVALLDDRERELASLQGTPESRVKTRKGADRVYWYQVYDDLSSGKTDPALVRPNLGNSKDLPYPRRLATNRGTEPDGREKGAPEGEDYWLPYDEQFSSYKNKDFMGDAITAVLPKVFAVISESGNNPDMKLGNIMSTLIKGKVNQAAAKLTGQEANIDNYEDFADSLAMFKKDAGGSESLKPTMLYPKGSQNGGPAAATPAPAASAFRAADGAWDFTLDDATATELNKSIEAEKAASGPLSKLTSTVAKISGKVADKLKGGVKDINELLYFPVPKVLEGRPDAWYTDEEYGRQILAGFNPMVISALKVLPETFGSAIRGEHINAELQGSTLEQLVAEAAAGAKPRLFHIDYWDLSAFWDDAEKKGVKTGMVQHAGRAVFYLRKDANGNDDGLIPVAFELAHPDTHKTNKALPRSAGVVYSRAALAHDPQTLAVWRLAKFVFKSLDSAFHQLVSHWNRTHACMEPFLIAMKRQISVMHPVYKLMVPHFRYTLHINRNARQQLISSGGTIEGNFSAGPYALRLASAVYGKYWTFASQALPEDLKARGMVDPSGKPWTNYPYADDGLAIWGALTKYFETYLGLYYKSDADVVGDSELQAWWNEVKTEGHPDLVKFGLRTEAEVWGFTGPIPSVAKLVHILATIAYMTSAHHAAVNFGQYDFAALTLNCSSCIRRNMPAPGEKAYTDLVNAAIGTPQERIIMKYLAGPKSAAKVGGGRRMRVGGDVCG
ncbi:hypothetical protein GPECTOR_13g860 [Gonium pectorale]|uniref:Lipoxygenase n=1 Tax=Gonium pectorale TaxID=33097 RepID=A0A150GNJ9_GONPE|nr:hypothetical protein GPECTOR_13g860 [Gonium pectorale]|eukprot:KXZ51371.1 hypothetical protein GPECTOR_13g860 [Gonium pectorale]